MTILPFVVGIRFKPTDEVLIGNYLLRKVQGLPYHEGAIKDFDLYGMVEPWTVFEMFGGVEGQDLYFFTKLKRMSTSKPASSSSSRFSRRVGVEGGTWSSEDRETLIYSSSANTDDPIGFRKCFRYENGGLEHHGEWIMHEYSLNLPNNGDDYVLCRIRKNDQHVKKAQLKRMFDLEAPYSSLEQDNAIVVEEVPRVAHDHENVEGYQPQMEANNNENHVG